MTLRLSMFSVLLCMLSNAALAQQPKDCLPALQPDIVDLSHNLETTLILLDKMSSESRKDDQTKIGAKYDDDTFDFSKSQKVRA
jgi:hypothetical protein